MPTATKRYFNWENAGFTPAGGSLIPIDGVTSVRFGTGGAVDKFYGDGDLYPSTIVYSREEPSITITSGNVAALLQLPGGTRGTFTVTLMDAVNKLSTGAITFTVIGCVVRMLDLNGQHKQFPGPTLTIDVGAADGITNPVSTSIAA